MIDYFIGVTFAVLAAIGALALIANIIEWCALAFDSWLARRRERRKRQPR